MHTHHLLIDRHAGRLVTNCVAGAMKLVADCFPWARQSMFAYAHDNHNSIVGMREVAMAAGASAMCVVLSAGTCLVARSLSSSPMLQICFAYTCLSYTAPVTARLRALGRWEPVHAWQPSDPCSPATHGQLLATMRHVMSTMQHHARHAPLVPHRLHSMSGAGQPHHPFPCLSGVTDFPPDQACLRFSDVADGDTPGPASPLMTDPHAHAHAQPAQGTCLHLLAMPLESNFSGAVYDPAQAAESVAAYPEDLLGELDDLHPSNRWLLLLDAAKACATKPPDLSRSPADFVVSSPLPSCVSVACIPRQVSPCSWGKSCGTRCSPAEFVVSRPPPSCTPPLVTCIPVCWYVS